MSTLELTGVLLFTAFALLCWLAVNSSCEEYGKENESPYDPDDDERDPT